MNLSELTDRDLRIYAALFPDEPPAERDAYFARVTREAWDAVTAQLRADLEAERERDAARQRKEAAALAFETERQKVGEVIRELNSAGAHALAYASGLLALVLAAQEANAAALRAGVKPRGSVAQMEDASPTMRRELENLAATAGDIAYRLKQLLSQGVP